MAIPQVSLRAQQQEQARRPPALTATHSEPRSAAGAVDVAERIWVGDLASPTDYRTTRHNDGRRHPGRSAERHVRVRSRSASTLGVGQYAARSKPAFAGRRIGRRDLRTNWWFPDCAAILRSHHARRWSSIRQRQQWHPGGYCPWQLTDLRPEASVDRWACLQRRSSPPPGYPAHQEPLGRLSLYPLAQGRYRGLRSRSS